MNFILKRQVFFLLLILFSSFFLIISYETTFERNYIYDLALTNYVFTSFIENKIALSV